MSEGVVYPIRTRPVAVCPVCGKPLGVGRPSPLDLWGGTVKPRLVCDGCWLDQVDRFIQLGKEAAEIGSWWGYPAR